MSTTATTPEKPARKFPAPCWTQEETLALIDAYRERWYALRRGYLRTADWDAVAATVGARCPDASPAKTSAQCRHKMEKLRGRYRAEKQRSLSFPGRFFSSWFFFENMDSMEIGSSSAVESNLDTGNRVDPPAVLSIKSLGDRDLVESVFRTRKSKKVDGDPNPNIDVDQIGVDPVGEFRVKTLVDRNSVTFGVRTKNSSKVDVKSSTNFSSRVPNGYALYLDEGSDEDVDDDIEYGASFRVRTPMEARLVPPVLRAKKLGKFHGNFGPNFDAHGLGGEGGGGFGVKNPIDQHLGPPGFRAKKFGKFDGKFNTNFECADEGYGVKVSRDSYSVPRTKSSGKNEGNSCLSPDPHRVMNGFSSSSFGSRLGKKSGRGGVKRERGDAVEEMVSSIRMLGEGFMKMETMKIEMAREIEKMRMEMETKRNELILESQRQIVDAFVTVLLEKKANTATVSPEQL